MSSSPAPSDRDAHVAASVRSALHFAYGDDSALGPVLREAFMAGFTVSGEGWNGEHPFRFDAAQIDNALDEKFNVWLRETA